MRAYTPVELRRFLEGVDAALQGEAEVVVIGGAAAAIEYGVVSGTRDIDTGRGFRRTWRSLSSVLDGRQGSRCRSRRAGSPTAQPSSSHDSNGRCRTSSGWQVKVPEKHDLVLMKVVRGDEHDRRPSRPSAHVPLDLEPS